MRLTDQLFKRLLRPSPWMLDLTLLVLGVALPYFQFMDRSRMSVAVLAGIYIMLGLSLNIIVGYAGLFQLGHAAFFGLGSYTAAVLSIEHHITIMATIPVAALVAGIAALLITKPILHLRGDYLCIVTIAFGEIFRVAVTNNAFGITGGPNGLSGTGRPEFPLPWVQPVPVIVLALILALHLFMTRRNGPLLQWGGAGVLALGYYLPPILLDAHRLFVISIGMGLAALIVSSILRGQRVSVRGQLAALILVAGAFALFMAVRSDALTAGIDGNLEKYFKVQDPVKFAGIDFTLAAFKRDARPYYYLVLIFIVLTIIGMRRLQSSRLGRAWLYVREDQLAAEAMGIDTTQIKLAAFVIGSAWAGVAGVLYASRFTVVAPENFNFLQSVIMFCIVVLGGSGSISGVLIGTLGMVVLPELMRDVAPTFLYKGTEPLVILGVILASYLYNARQRWQSAALESAAVVAAFVIPPLLLDQSSLFALGLLMALFAVLLIGWTRRHTARPLPWIAGGLAVYTLAVLVLGGTIGPDLERELAAFRIMDWRDGLMGVAMVTMMILRPAGIIPERRQGTTVSPPDQAAARVPATATQ